VHLVSLAQEDQVKDVDAVYEKLKAAGIDVLYDDRPDVRAGGKLADADLIGIPHRLVVSKKTLESQKVEWKERTKTEAVLVGLDEFINHLKRS
jgi:prolyl-tRNA synthetase